MLNEMNTNKTYADNVFESKIHINLFSYALEFG